MEIKGTLENGVITVTLCGRLDYANAIVTEQSFLKYAERGSTFVLDLSGVDFIASAGMRALLSLYRTVQPKGGSVTILHPQSQVCSVLKEAGFQDLFIIK